MRRHRDGSRGRRETVRAFRVWRRRVCVAVLLATLSAVTVPTVHMWWATTAYERYLARIATVARWKLKLGFSVTETRAMRAERHGARGEHRGHHPVERCLGGPVPGPGGHGLKRLAGRGAGRRHRGGRVWRICPAGPPSGIGAEGSPRRNAHGAELIACVQPVQARVSQFIFSNARHPGLPDRGHPVRRWGGDPATRWCAAPRVWAERRWSPGSWNRSGNGGKAPRFTIRGEHTCGGSSIRGGT